MSMHEEGMGISSLLVMITLGLDIHIYREFDALDTFIEFKEGSDNLLGKHIFHFD